MRVLLVGPPGAGKGTQATMLAERNNALHIASGNLLRDEMASGSELGQKVKELVDRGDLVPDDVIVDLVATQIARSNGGFVLDGFPRTRAQAIALDRILEQTGKPLDIVIRMKVNEEELIRRITGRRVCPSCGRTYHMVYAPPEDDESCDADGTKLVTRADDTLEKLRHRLDIYRKEASELSTHYESRGLMKRIDGIGEMDEITKRIDEAIEAGL